MSCGDRQYTGIRNESMSVLQPLDPNVTQFFLFMQLQKKQTCELWGIYIPFERSELSVCIENTNIRCVKVVLLEYSENGNDDTMAYFMKIKLNGGVSLFFFHYLFVCRHSALPPRIDRCISRTSLSLPWRWVNKWETTREKHNRKGWQLRQAKWIYEWEKPGNQVVDFS